MAENCKSSGGKMNKSIISGISCVLSCLLGLLFIGTQASASSCDVSCSAYIVTTLSEKHVSTSEGIQDFKENCGAYLKGHSTCLNGFCMCKRTWEQSGHGFGIGSDVAEARAEARKNCSQYFPRGAEDSVSISYSGYSCNP